MCPLSIHHAIVFDIWLQIELWLLLLLLRLLILLLL